MWGFNGVRQKRGQEQSGDGRTQDVGGGRWDAPWKERSGDGSRMGDGMGTVTKRGMAWYVGGEGSWGWDWKGDER